VRIAVTLVALALGSPALAAEMWGKVESGMSWDQVAALYPAEKGTKHKAGKSIEVKNVAITPDCKAEANILFKAGAVDSVVLKGNPAVAGRCAETVYTALSSKYGQAVGGGDVEGGLFARPGKIHIWNKPPLTLRFKKFEDGGDITRASWELTYSTIGAAIGL